MSEPKPASDTTERLQRWFSELQLMTEDSRRSRISGLAADDPELAKELAALFSQATVNDLENTLERLIQQGTAPLPTEIAGFRILGVLGRGGMGVVYLAERSMAETVQRVALKVLAGTLLSPETLAHFYAERRILAALNHPHIATLIEAGTARDGTPYLAMEYIDGQPIDAHAQTRNLDRVSRVRLGLGVLSAIAYAHRNLIVHRDLKPSNILVTTDNVPKLVDFGIAKLIQNGQALTTRSRMYTPEYASPEQMQDGPVTTAADIYAFGIVLHELLTGRRPGRSPAGERPLDASLPRDLKRILARMLEVDPQARYESAAAVADDLSSHLAGAPLKHAHESPRERLYKHLHRHRFVWTAAGLTLAAAIAIAANISLSAKRLAQERDRALAAQESAQQVSEFLVSVFEQADPDVARGNTITARDLLDNGARRIDGLAGADASAQAQLYEALGRVYQNLGLADPAIGLYQRALSAHDRLAEPQLARRLGVLRRLIDAHQSKGEMDVAERFLDQALKLAEADPALPKLDLALLMRARANHLQQRGNAPASDAELAKVVALLDGIGAVDTETYAQTLQLHSQNLLESGKPREALGVLEQVYAIRRKVLGEDHSRTAFTLGQIGRTQRDLGEQKAALATLNTVMDMRVRVLGPRHPDVGLSANELANLYHDMGNVQEAERYYRLALEIDRETGGAQAVSAAFVLNNLAILLESAGRFEEAEPLYRESIAIRRKHAGKDDGLRVVKAEQNYAVLLSKLSRYDEAIPLFENALALRMAELGPDHLDTRITRANLDGVRYQRAPSAATAESSRQSWQALIDLLGDQPPMRAMFEVKLAHLLLDAGRLEEAEAGFRTALATFASQDAAAGINVALAELGLGLVLARRNRLEEARPLIERARKLAEPTLAPNSAFRRELARYDAQ